MTGAQVAILAAAFTGIAGVLAVAAWLYFQPGDDGHVWAATEPEPVELPALTATVRTRRTGPMSGAPDWAIPVDDDTEAWLHQLVVEGRAQQAHRLTRPARVMADPVLSRLAVLGRAVAMAARPGQFAPIVSGPALAPVLPAPVQPPQRAAGPETPFRHQHGAITSAWCQPCADEKAFLPPVGEATHLQPIDWADTTGSFRAICEADQ